MKFYGWIPILSSQLLSENVSPDKLQVFPKKNSDTDDSQEVDGTPTFDANNLLTHIQLHIPEKGDLDVICNISNTGLYSFEFQAMNVSQEALHNRLFNNGLSIFIADIIRDIYHHHVHHGHDDDCKLKPVEAATDSEAIEKILTQYHNKIFQYQKDVKTVKNIFGIPFTRFFKMNERIDLSATALGEFIYAKSFIKLHNGNLQNSDNIIHSFECASGSVQILRDNFSWRMSFVLSISAVFIAVVALISVIEPAYKIYKHFKAPAISNAVIKP